MKRIDEIDGVDAPRRPSPRRKPPLPTAHGLFGVPTAVSSLADRVRRVQDERVNPGVALHGGRITLVDLRDGVAYLRMGGGCQGCGMSAITLRLGVERTLKEEIPELAGVENVTDHASGTNPYC